MNKKGFTLVELIAVIVIIGIIAVIAIPNVVNMVDSSKKSQFITDAKEMISEAKYKIKLEKYWSDNTFETDSNGCALTTAAKLGFKNLIDPDGNTYNLTECKVKRCIEGGNQIYYVVTITSNTDTSKTSRGVYNKTRTEGYVKEEELLSDNANNYVVELNK